MNPNAIVNNRDELLARAKDPQALIPDSFERSPLREIWAVLRKRRLIALTVFALCIGIAVAYCLLARPLYEAKGLIEVSNDSQDDLNIGQIALSGDTDVDKKVQTQVQILTTESVILETVDELKLRNDPWLYKTSGLFWTKKPAPETGDLPPDIRESIVKKFRDHLSVTVVPRTMVIAVNFQSPHADMSAKIVNTLIHKYFERNYSVRYQAVTEASTWLAKQLTALKTNTETAQSQLVDYQKKHNILLLGDEQGNNDVTLKLQELSKQLTAAQTDRIMKEAKYRLAETGNPELVAQVTENSTLSLLRGQEADLKSQYAEALSKYGNGYARVPQLKERLGKVQQDIQREVKNITESLKLDFQGASQTEGKLSSTMDSLRAEAFKLNSDAVGYEVLQREVVASQELYQSLKEKLEEAGVLAGLRSNNTDLLDAARPASKPAVPNLPLSLLLAMCAGVVGGVSCALVAEKVDDKVSGDEDIEGFTGLPALVFIPVLKADKSKNGAKSIEPVNVRKADLPALDHPRSEFSEAFRSLRSAVLLSSNGVVPKIQVVTSTFPSEGKSTVAINTAISFALQGARVLLIDGDLRRPSIHDRLLTPSQHGLSEILSGQIAVEDTLYSLPRLPNLQIISAGPVPPQPSELLGSSRMTDLLQYARKNFDFVVIDSPPVLSVTDAVVLSSMVDRVLYVCRAGTTSKYALRRGLNVLLRSNARLAGIVMNAINPRSEIYYRYYGYGKYRDYYGDNQ